MRISVKFLSVVEPISSYEHFKQKPCYDVDTGRPSGTRGVV